MNLETALRELGRRADPMMEEGYELGVLLTGEDLVVRARRQVGQRMYQCSFVLPWAELSALEDQGGTLLQASETLIGMLEKQTEDHQ